MNTQRTLWREYGAIAVVILIAVSGYFFFAEHKEDILSYSLDTVGSRLVAMVDAPEKKEAIAELFANFKEQVLAHQVSPEQVENITANVLNMSNSGAHLSSEEAEMVLRLAYEPEGVSLPSPGSAGSQPSLQQRPPKPIKPEPIKPSELNALGKRMESVLTFNDQVMESAERHAISKKDVARHVRVRFDKGLHVRVDGDMRKQMSDGDFKRLVHEADKLERKKLLVWHQHLADEMKAHEERATRELQAVVALKENQEIQVGTGTMQTEITTLETLKNMEIQGYTTAIDMDSVSVIVMTQMENVLDQYEDVLDDETMETVREEIEEAMEVMQKEMEAAKERQQEAQVSSGNN